MTTSAGEITPTEVADRLAIRELFDAYAHCEDRRDAKGQKSLFTEDTNFLVYMQGEGSEPTQELNGREALTPGFDDLNRYDATTHFNGQSTGHAEWGPSERRELLPRSPPVHGGRRAQADGRLPSVSRHLRQDRRGLAVRRTQALRRLDRDSFVASLSARPTVTAGPEFPDAVEPQIFLGS